MIRNKRKNQFQCFQNHQKHTCNLSSIAAALDQREEKLAAVYEELETDLELLGATAIEDKLQVRFWFF